MLDLLDQECFLDDNVIFLEPSCGDGVFIEAILKRMPVGRTSDYYINRLIAFDIDPQKVDKTRNMIRSIIGDNNLINERIICANFLDINLKDVMDIYND